MAKIQEIIRKDGTKIQTVIVPKDIQKRFNTRKGDELVINSVDELNKVISFKLIQNK